MVLPFIAYEIAKTRPCASIPKVKYRSSVGCSSQQSNRAVIIEDDDCVEDLNSVLAEVLSGLLRIPFVFQLAPLVLCTVYTTYNETRTLTGRLTGGFQNIEDVW